MNALHAARRDEAGTTAVEFALAFPIFIFALLACMQLALIMVQQYNAKNLARDAARWLAVNPDTTDQAFSAHVLASLQPGMSAALTSVGASPACPALTSGQCASRSSGSELTVTVNYSAANLLFLPATWNFAGFSMAFPVSQAAIQVSVMDE